MDTMLSNLRTPTAELVPANEPKPLAVGAAELGKLLGLGLRTVRSMDSAGRLPRPIRLGGSVRWRLDEIEAWLAAGAPNRDEWEALQGIGTRRFP